MGSSHAAVEALQLLAKDQPVPVTSTLIADVLALDTLANAHADRDLFDAVAGLRTVVTGGGARP